MRLCTVIVMALLAQQLAGCAAVNEWAQQDRRDAPWDPKLSQGQTLFDQMPAWDNAAEKNCCGSKRQCLEGQTPRC
jgi:hypothetical protein